LNSRLSKAKTERCEAVSTCWQWTMKADDVALSAGCEELVNAAKKKAAAKTKKPVTCRSSAACCAAASSNTFNMGYTLAKLTPEDVLTIHKGLREGLQNHPLVHSSDPAISDVASDDVAREMGRILEGVEKQLAKAKKDREGPS
jgi:hypothetical protein